MEFYSPEFIATTLRPRKLNGGSKLGGKDPNGVYVGKRVIVVGAGSRKGYKGLIKATSPNGDAWVELEACQQRVEQMRIDHLAILCVFLICFDDRKLTDQ